MRMKRTEENCVKDLLLTNRTMGCGFVVLLNWLQSGFSLSLPLLHSLFHSLSFISPLFLYFH